ncbi:MAG: TonB-dependent receptor [bacterium]
MYTKIVLQKKFCVILLIFLFPLIVFSSPQGKITGYVVNAADGSNLPGANVMVSSDEFRTGDATDLQGYFIISSIPSGTYKLVVTYIGFKKFEKEVVITSGDVLSEYIELEHETIKGERVVISGQAAGQTNAINQQISSNTIKNIVAAERIQELPEANAAEAVGRLPGISLQREGGEGNKVVIRGLSPKYSKIQIEGVTMSSTNNWDRSTDLSMISPYILEGIEVSKAAMADQEADQIGGTVNFKIREAEDKPMLDVISQGGYNDLRGEFGDYKFVAMASKRFFGNLLGVYANIDVERVNRSSNSVDASYGWFPEEQMAAASTFGMADATRENNRYGGTLVLDYKTLTSKIKLSNVYNQLERSPVNRSISIGDIRSGGSLSNMLNYHENTMTTLTNALDITQYIGNIKVQGGVSHSYAENEVPEELRYGGILSGAVESAPSYTIHPDKIPSLLVEDRSDMLLSRLDINDYRNEEREWSANLNLEWGLSISEALNIQFKTGGKYKHKNREYDYNNLNYPIIYGKIRGQNLILRNYPWMEEYITGKHSSGYFPYEPFIDHDFDPGDFMAGDYEITGIPDLELGRDVIYLIRDSIGVNMQGADEPRQFIPDFHASLKNDYQGTEDYWAVYVLPQITIGKNDQVKFVPGLRYERNKTDYTGIRGNGRIKNANIGYVYHEKEYTRENDFLLPMIHLKVKPLNWMDLRLSYTKTLARPSYMEFIPSWHFYPSSSTIEYKNFQLKPEKATNIDLYLSVYGNKIGLFTVGGFQKEIKDMIFWKPIYLLTEDMVIEYGLTEDETGYETSSLVQNRIDAFINNPHKAKIWGIETEWQSNFWFLPGLLKNIVLNINYTHIFSEARYPKVIPQYEWVTEGLFPVKQLVGVIDSSYSAPLLDQPDDMLNLTIGYDYKGFSIRGSMQYKTDVFVSNNFYEELRGFTDALTLYDVSVKQKLPIQGLELFANISNVTKAVDRGHINQSTDFYTFKSYYGMTAGLGLRYRFQ